MYTSVEEHTYVILVIVFGDMNDNMKPDGFQISITPKYCNFQFSVPLSSFNNGSVTDITANKQTADAEDRQTGEYDPRQIRGTRQPSSMNTEPPN